MHELDGGVKALERLRVCDITGQAHIALDARDCTQSLALGKLKLCFFFFFWNFLDFYFYDFFNAEVAKNQ